MSSVNRGLVLSPCVPVHSVGGCFGDCLSWGRSHCSLRLTARRIQLIHNRSARLISHTRGVRNTRTSHPSPHVPPQK